jgi:hypothetical protein
MEIQSRQAYDLKYGTNRPGNKSIIPERQRILHKVEAKSYWDGVFLQTTEKECGNIIGGCRRKA